MATTSLEFRVGFRFHPTKEELVNHYLRKKILGHDDFNDVIPEIDICSCEPWDLPESDDDEWFYFSRPNYKPKGKSRNRATERGFWKITSREKVIKARRSKAVIGKKRTLTFYKGKVRSGHKTNWVMHEYYIPKTLLPNTATQRDFVLCHLKKKDESTDSGAGDEVKPGTNDACDFGNPVALVHGAGGPEENTQPEEILGSLFPSRASTESPQSYVSFSSIPRGNFLLTNASSANHIETEDETEFLNSIFVDQDDYSFEERTHATLNHSTVGEKLLGVAQEKHSIEDQDIEVQQAQAHSIPVASSLFEGDKDVVILNQPLGEHAFSANKEASGHQNIDHFQSVSEETKYQKSPGFPVEQHDSNMVSFAPEESSLNESSCVRRIALFACVHYDKAPGSMPSTSFETEESSLDESSNSDFIVESTIEGLPRVIGAGPWITFETEESSLDESSNSDFIADSTSEDLPQAIGACPSTTFATEESSLDESCHFDLISQSTSEDLPQATGACSSTTFATEESSLDESSHFDLISQSTSEQLPQPAGAGPSMPLKNHHYVLQGGAGRHNGSKGWFNVCKTSLVIHRPYLQTVYLLMILITSTFLLYTLAGNGRESVSLKPLLSFVKNVVIPVSVAVYFRERKHGILFSLLFSFCSYFLAHQICV